MTALTQKLAGIEMRA